MIGILLNDTAYEQDIRELLMAFYPGETFVHEKQDDVDFYVEGICTQNADETKFGLKITDPAGTVADETVFPIDNDQERALRHVKKTDRKRTPLGDPDRYPPDKDRHDET